MYQYYNPVTVVCKSWTRHAIRGESYDGGAPVPSISRAGVTQKYCHVTTTQSIIKVTEQSACYGRGGFTAFTERRVTGVLETGPHDSSPCVARVKILTSSACNLYKSETFKMLFLLNRGSV